MKSRLLSFLLPVKHAAGRLYRFLREWLAIPHNYMMDQYRYMRWSGSFAPGRSRQALQGLIMRLYHGVEVGLTYENPRPGFGLKVVNDLLGYLRIYVQKFGTDQTVRIAVHVLRLYLDYNRAQGLALESVAKKLERLKMSSESQEGEGGILTLQRQDILEDAAIDFSRFVASRHSFRRFESDPVPLERIEQAVRMAMQSPSACNRQPVRVSVLDDPGVRDRVLTVQNGNRGWRDQPDRILLVSTDLRYYKESRERNAAFIDGGLFAMSLIYALHSLGLGTCCLNLNLTSGAARRVKKAAGLGRSQVLILLIAVGRLPETIRVAASVRRELDEVLQVI